MSHDISRGFADIDRAAAPEPFLAFLEMVEALPAFRAYKLRLRTLLRLAPGQTVLDVGCGTGIEDIPLTTATDDACFTERVLTYVPDPVACL